VNKPNKKPLLVLDARLINTSGIGTVVQNTIPYLPPFFRVVLLGKPSELALFSWARACEIIDFDIPIYSIREQIAFIREIPACDIFFSPHYNVPLLKIKALQRVVIIHDVNHAALAQDLSFLQRKYARLVINRALKLSNQVITVSNFSKTEIVKYFGIQEKCLQVIKLGVDKEIFKADEGLVKQVVKAKFQLPDGFVLYVGNVKPHKNLKTLVNALGILKKERPAELPHLVIVGKKDGFITEDTYIIDLINSLHLQDHIKFTGYVAKEDLPAIYNLASLFVFPSFYEGFGLPPVEAMACGCPTLVARAASMPEICQEASEYFNPTDPNELAQKITYILQNEPVLQNLKAKGLALAQTYNWQNTAQEILNIIGLNNKEW
jgi:glycosyltransferase involved in cell wall biosynthesis